MAHDPDPIRLAQLLEASEARARQYEEIHDQSPNGVMIFAAVRGDGGGIVDFEWRYSNPSANRIVGRGPGELIGKRLLEEMPGNREAGLFDIYVRVVETGTPHSHEFPYRYEGLDHWFQSTSIKLGDGFYVAFVDLTARKRAQEESAQLAAIVASSEDAIFSTSLDGTVETWNQGAARIFGYEPAELVGKPIELLVPEDRREEYARIRQRALEGNVAESYQTVRLTKAGGLVHVSVTLNAIVDAAGKVTGIASIVRDMSRHVELQRRLLVADRMASVGTLAAGVAHEINNPLSYVIANLDFVREHVRELGAETPSARMRELDEITTDAIEGAERIRQIVRGMKTFSRPDEERLNAMDLHPVIELAIHMAMHEIRPRAGLVKDFGAVPPVVADESRLVQALIHTLVNASKAIPEGRPEVNEIRIVTRTDSHGRAVIEVRDTGCGISEEALSRVFDPFFTTRQVGSGIGLGLSICHSIITGLGGELTVESQVCKGTVITILLLPADLDVEPLAGATPQE